MSAFIISATEYAIHAQGQSAVHGEATILVGVEDHGGGAFLRIESVNTDSSDAPGRVLLDFKQLALVVEAAALLRAAHE